MGRSLGNKSPQCSCDTEEANVGASDPPTFTGLGAGPKVQNSLILGLLQGLGLGPVATHFSLVQVLGQGPIRALHHGSEIATGLRLEKGFGQMVCEGTNPGPWLPDQCSVHR